MIDFVLEMIDGEKFKIDNVTSFELNRSIDAACDGLRIKFITNTKLKECCKLYAYQGKKLVFNGLVDVQKQQAKTDGCFYFIYARSCACLLIENEAEPISYSHTTLKSLCHKNAFDLGFSWDLPDVVCNDYYEIQKGSSCFGVINNFAKAMTGKGVYVDSNNVIRLLDSENVFHLDSCSVIEESETINRDNAITTIDYKANGDDNYNHHFTSRFIHSRDIKRSQKINVLSLPSWQREMVVRNMMEKRCANYYCLEVLLNDYADVNLCDRIVYNSENLGFFNDYYIAKITYTNGEKGVNTKIVAYQKLDIKEINYVVK